MMAWGHAGKDNEVATQAEAPSETVSQKMNEEDKE